MKRINSHTTVTRSLFWSFMEQGSSKAVAMVVQIVLARLLSPEAFGVLAILLVVTNIADAIAQSGLGSALIQKRDADSESYDTAFWLSMCVASALYVLIFLSAPLMASYYKMPELVRYLRVLALIVFVNSGNSIQRSYLQKNFDFKGIFKISLSAVVLSGAVGVAAALCGLGVWSLIIQSVTQSFVTFVAMLVVVPWTPRLRFRGSEALALFSYGWKMCVTSILNVMYSGISELIIGRACSASELGLYSQGRKYPHAAISVMTNAMSNVLFPAFSKSQHDVRLLASKVRVALTVGTLVVAPMGVWCSVIANPLVHVLLGEKWMRCVPIFQLTCLSNSLLMLQLSNLRAYMALGRSDLHLRLQTIKVIIGIVVIGGTAALTHSIYATAVATTLSALFSILMVDLWPAKALLGYGRLSQVRDVAPIFVAAVLAGAIAWPFAALFESDALKLLFQTIVYGVSYLVLCRIINPEPLDVLFGRVKSLIGR